MDFCDVYLFLHFTSGLIILWVAECVLVSVVELALDIEVHAVMNQEPIQEEIYPCYFSISPIQILGGVVMMRNQYEKKFTSATFLNFSNFASFFSCSSLSRSAAPSTYLRGEEDEGNQSLILKTKYVELGLISISSYLLFEPPLIVDVPLPPASKVPHGLVVGCCFNLKDKT